MLRRLNVRMRLVAVLIVPFVLLLAVAGPEVLQRRDAAREADRAAALTDASSDLAAALDGLEEERILSSAVRAGAGDDAIARLDEQRATTDAAVDAAVAALGRIRTTAPSIAPAAAAVEERLGQLDDVRAGNDLAESIVPWIDPFVPLMGSLLDLHEAVGGAISEPAVRDLLREVALLARSKEAASAQAAQLAAATVWGELRGDQVGILSGLRADEEAFRTAHIAAAPATQQVERRADVGAGAATTAGRAVDTVIREGSVDELGSLGTWLALSGQRQDVLNGVELDRTGAALSQARDAGTDARRASTVYLVLAGLGLLLGVGLALAAARSITRPLRRLTTAADHLAEERLPKLVDALRHPGEDDERFLATTIQPIEVHSDDELGHLARAFNTVQAVAVEVAAEQADLLRKGISDLYVNLARRNQSLLQRQIRLLDRVQREDQEPEVLEHLYELDHLATRMRRNAESLLVLAGADPDRRRSQPAPAVDVVRAAVGEVEQYGRVELGAMETAVLRGQVVSDVSHIVAELLENATQFSAPDTTVRVDGRQAGNGYQLVITDRGVGMTDAQLEELNALLRDPPVTGLALGRALGCLVAARLAARHDIAVRLRAGDLEGIVATVNLPRHLLVAEEVQAPEPPPEPEGVLPAPDDDPWLYEWGEAAGPITIGALPPAATLSEALPTADQIDAGLEAILEQDPSAGMEAHPPRGTDLAAAPVTTSGLARRIPGAPAPASSSTPGDASPARRSPDQVRALLSSYRSGLQAGRDQAPRPEE